MREVSNIRHPVHTIWKRTKFLENADRILWEDSRTPYSLLPDESQTEDGVATPIKAFSMEDVVDQMPPAAIRRRSYPG